jgi:Tfp pilus assembly protein PilP
MRVFAFAIGVAWVLAPIAVIAQASTPTSAAPVQPAAPPAAAPVAPSEPRNTYTYQREGRRDPFLSLIGTGTEPRTAGSRRGEGPASLTTAEISVRGIVQSRGELVAMVHAPDNRTYLVHQGDKLADGTIKTITPQGLVIIQEVNDPLSLVKQREVRKLLRSLEDGKE